MAPWRIALMVIVIAAAAFGPQILVAVGLHVSWIASLALLVVGIGVAVLLVRTSPRSQSGKGLLVFASGSVTLMPLEASSSRRESLIPSTVRFFGDERVSIDRVSDVWARLRLIRPDGSITFQAGIRSPRTTEPELRDAISLILAQARAFSRWHKPGHAQEAIDPPGASPTPSHRSASSSPTDSPPADPPQTGL